MTLAAEGIALAGRLQPTTLALEPGTVTAICGPNGAGKSTLLEILAGLQVPSAGTALLDGAPIASLAPRARAWAIGYLPQEAAIAWDLSVRNLVALGRLPHGDALAGPVDAAIMALELGGFADRPVSTLSGGERARVLLARVLAGTPRWICADEPLAALDLAHQRRLARHFRAVAEEGAGVALVIHDLALARNHADRVVVLDRGCVAADGPPDEALREDVIAHVWNVGARWHGGDGEWALGVT